MINHSDTIAAISTPAGLGGIGIVRLSGERAVPIADAIFKSGKSKRLSCARSHTLSYGHIIDLHSGAVADEVLVSVMRTPNSYTREDVVEINCHGGTLAVRKVLEIVLRQGARLALPGEFTLRAFLNGRISLSQAEAVLDMISAKTEESMRVAVNHLKGGLSEKLSEIRNRMVEISAFAEALLDFPEDDIETKNREEITVQLSGIIDIMKKLAGTFEEAQYFREGLSVAIVGRPNVGKSSLLNALVLKEKAIVTEIPGTTRDMIEDYINIKGLPVRIIDTAGIRSSSELVEQEGIRRSLEAIENADFIIAMFDGSMPETEDDRELLHRIREKRALVVINKTDLPEKISLKNIRQSMKKYLHISVKTGTGIEEMKSHIFNSTMKNWQESREGIVVTNVRHKESLDRAVAAITAAQDILAHNRPLELFSLELRDALDSIGEITGAVTSEEILNKIFSDFCIGK